MRSVRYAVWLCLLMARTAAADAGQPVSSATWQYEFPAGVLSTSQSLSADLRYLATRTTRWTYHPVGKPEAVTTEGENAVYLFDLVEKRLLWKQGFAEGSTASVRGVTASGELVAVQVGGSTTERQLNDYHGGGPVEGTITVGAREPGMRLYDRQGHLLARNAPLETGWIARSRASLLIAPPGAGEASLSEELTAALAAAGVRATAVRRATRGFRYLERQKQRLIAYCDLDGVAEWEYALPPSRSLGLETGGWGMLERSVDGEYALALVVPTDVVEPSETRRLLLFGRSTGLLWMKDLDMRVGGKGVAAAYAVNLALSAGASSIVVERGPSPNAVVQVFDAEGRQKSAVAFGAIIPDSLAVSPNGRYWAAALKRFAQGPGTDDKGWSEGIHVFDCDTGKVVWRSPAGGTALTVFVTDSGGVIAISPEERTLVVFDPPS